ncbi:unnamed protein product [Rotaria sp. Silwood2]|nr:unnamed protein product [Rotaria sp. Silwood2]
MQTIQFPISRFKTYQHSTELQPDVANLWWTVDETEAEIMFELHIKTTGWIALGISPAGGMKGADIGVGWIDNRGQIHFQDQYAFGFTKPVTDNTTTDWFPLQGREENGWTAIQFKRLLDTCDSMDVPIKSGSNIVIFAYGLIDPDMFETYGDISYHENRRNSRMIPLRTYANPPSDDKFVEFDYVEFRLDNYRVPSTDTTYHCKIFKAPSHFLTKRHAIARKVLIDKTNHDLVHHMLIFECDPSIVFDDNNLPDDLCDNLLQQLQPCFVNSATGWAVGGNDIVEFPDEIGYPIGGDFVIKYYLIQIHYDNPRLTSNRRDSSGIRYYIDKKLRRYDLGYLTFGTGFSIDSIVIPPKMNKININYEYLKQLLLSIKRTAELAEQWQEFYNNATRLVVFGRAEHLDSDILENLPKFENLKPVECRKEPIVNSATSNTIDFSLAFISYLLQKILSYNK